MIDSILVDYLINKYNCYLFQGPKIPENVGVEGGILFQYRDRFNELLILLDNKLVRLSYDDPNFFSLLDKHVKQRIIEIKAFNKLMEEIFGPL